MLMTSMTDGADALQVSAVSQATAAPTFIMSLTSFMTSVDLDSVPATCTDSKHIESPVTLQMPWLCAETRRSWIDEA